LKRLKFLVSAVLSAAVFISSCPVAFAAVDVSQPWVECDTTVNFTLDHGKTYAYKMTVHGTHSNPKIATGNSKVLQTERTIHKTEGGNDVYYFIVHAIGKNGEAAGVYTTLPGQAAVRHSDIAIPYVSGMYKAGSSIKAGQYVLTPNKGNSGYYEIRTSPADFLDNLETYDLFNGRRYVTVKNGQYLILQHTTMIPAKDAGKFLSNNGKYSETMFKVGFDIPAGTYRVQAASSDKFSEAYIELKNSDGGSPGSTAYDDYFTGNRDVKVSNGQYLIIEYATMTKFE